MTAKVNFEYLQAHVSGLFYESTVPFNSIDGAFGRCKPRFVQPRVGSDKCAVIVDLPALNPVGKSLWKEQNYYGSRKFVEEPVINIISQ